MNTVELKSDLHSLIDRVEDTTILNAIRAILSKEVKEEDFWDDLPLSVQESVKRGMEQAKRGETKPHSEVMKRYENWL
jgi:predicted transcriptional regulator